MNKSLLEVFCDEANCDFISDLHLVPKEKLTTEILLKISDEDFNLSQWNEAVSYICRKKCNFSSSIEAKTFLIEYLRK